MSALRGQNRPSIEGGVHRQRFGSEPIIALNTRVFLLWPRELATGAIVRPQIGRAHV